MRYLMQALNFLNSNWLYMLWFTIYFSIAWVILGATLNSFFIVLAIYAISIAIALSPVGEEILRFIENCREPETAQERDYLMPLFEEVYHNAMEMNPKLNRGIKLYVMDAMYVNAFAIGRKTVAVTRGAIATFSADELKGVLAHELGHMNHGHTKALLLSVIGNFFFSVIVWAFRLISRVVQFIANVVAQFNIVALVIAGVLWFFRLCISLSVFVFINLSEILLALNSRTNEIQADNFAYEIGYGRELISGLYLLQKINITAKPSFSEKIKASHPHIAHRIGNLERLEQLATGGYHPQ